MGPLPIYRHTLTGSCRARRGWFGRVVMEVEVKIESLEPWPAPPMPPHPNIPGDGERYKRECAQPLEHKVKGTWYEWRDAKISDFVLSTYPARALSFRGST